MHGHLHQQPPRGSWRRRQGRQGSDKAQEGAAAGTSEALRETGEEGQKAASGSIDKLE